MTSKRSSRQDLTPAGRLEETNIQTVLGYQLAQATIVTDAIFRNVAREVFDLRPVEFTVLALVAENPGGSLARLARALCVTAPHITAIIDLLESRGLIKRSASSEDRRAQVLNVTRAGADVARKATDRLSSEEARKFSLTLGERAILAELLHRVACARD